MEGRVLMTPDEITAHMSDAHRELDAALETVRQCTLTIESLTEQGVSIGMVGHLKGKLAIHQARALTGLVAAVGEKSAEIHLFDYSVAQKAGIATAPLTTIAGVIPQGGTR